MSSIKSGSWHRAWEMKSTSQSDVKKIEFNVHVLYNKLNILVFTKQYVQDYRMHILMYSTQKWWEQVLLTTQFHPTVQDA